jgi:hypothetical protein
VTSRSVVVDDHILLRLLLDDEPPDLRPLGAAVATTGLWYHRLCRALSNTSVTGSLSRSLGRADADIAASAVRAATALPETIGLVSLRELAWPMADSLVTGVGLNLMSLEALVAAEHLDAEICLASVDDNPSLIEAAAARNVATRLIDL